MQHYQLQASSYPRPWREIDQSPAQMWANKSLSDFPWHHLWQKPRLAVIGSRQHSLYGEYMVKQFVQELVERWQVVIVSGCARGIDSLAHQQAVVARGQTIGILGGGLNHQNPWQKRFFAQPRALLLSEFEPDFAPQRFTFVQRNRLIAASAEAVLVVEACARSGTLITVNYALEQGKDVFVIPQSLWNKNYQGACDLVNLGAQLVTSPAELAREVWGIGGTLSSSNSGQSKPVFLKYQKNLLAQAQTSLQKTILQFLLEKQGRVLLTELKKLIPDKNFEQELLSLQQRGLTHNTFGVVTVAGMIKS